MCGGGGTGGRWSGIRPGRAPSRPPDGGRRPPGGAPGRGAAGPPTWLPGGEERKLNFRSTQVNPTQPTQVPEALALVVRLTSDAGPHIF